MNLIELYFTITDYDMLLKISSKWKINVNGFANISKVPEIMLRKNLIQRFNGKQQMFKNLLDDIYGSKLKEMNVQGIDDFLYTFLSYPLKDKVAPHIALGLLILSYPDYVESKIDVIYDNFINQRHIFEGLLDKIEITEENSFEVIEKLLQLKEPIEYYSTFESETKGMLKLINQIENYEKLKEKFKDMDFYCFSKFFIENREIIPDYIAVLAYIAENIKQIMNLDDEKRQFYNKLLADAHTCLDIEVYRVVQERLNLLEEKNKLLEKEIKSKEEKIKLIEKDVKLLEESYLNYQEKIQKEIEELKSNMEIRLKNNLSNNNFEENKENTIITNYTYDRIFDAVGKCNIISPKNVNILDKILNYSGLVFIHRNSIISTRELLNLEKYLKSKGIQYYVIFGLTIEELVRNIIIKKRTMEVLS